VDNDFFFQQRDTLCIQKSELKRELGIAPETPVILYVAKLIPRKRPLDLLRAFEGLEPRAALVFVGEGVLRGELDAYAHAKQIADVGFVGFKNQTELPRYYAMADIFVLPSAYEPWGLVINEAMCFGLPIITTDGVAAAYDLVKENGFIYPIGDVTALRSRLQELILDPERRARMGRKSLEIISGWNYDADVQGILHALEFVRSGKGRSYAVSAMEDKR
jgi:glycosyltransferase involved in cell wall biosynthesis